MATEIKTWELVNGQLNPINTTLADNQRKEKEDLEQWIKTNPKIIGEDILIIGEQVQTKSGFLDFLGIDKNGNTVIIELKRDKLPRDVIAQTIDYASDVATWDIDKLSEICQGHLKQGLEDYLSEYFDEFNIEEVVINNNQRLLLVGFGIEEATNRMIEWLSNSFNLSINAVILNYSKTSSGNEILSRTVIIPEEIEIQKANKKKFTIARSDKAGEYESDKLKELLKKYLTKNLHSARRLKDVMLPALINGKTLTRGQLLKEFVKSGEAKDESQAGYFMSLISGQLGHEWKDYLRQVVEYGYPNYHWEKDNFKIREGYIDLVKELLDEINESE
ncbi:endonuclease NucS domain-containing protein [Saccharicrinis sp. FJH62]|uniref:endonuclease NucS domain-containing protein n=1 Tax=Saccharicrinis sp. FJH62 TaxID=3344657 RepID=UPI0035D504EF